MERQEELTELLTRTFVGHTGTFRPCAFFDDRLDCIRVITKDCSVIEERMNDRVTILLDLYSTPGQRKCVGFTLKGAYHLCQQHNWDATRPIQIGQLLNAIITSVPERSVKLFIELVAWPLVSGNNIEQVEAAGPMSLAPAS
jgi:hypothetical protein